MKIDFSEFRSLKKSFSFAVRGLIYCVKNERNMRIHIVAACLVLLFSILFGLNFLEYAILFLVIGLVFLCEIFNTAIEVLVNLNTPFYNSLAKIAKDVAAGAVFLSSIFSVIISLFLFFKPEKFMSVVIKIVTSPLLLCIFILFIMSGLVFIFKSFKINVAGKRTDDVKIYEPKKRRKFNF